MPTRSPARLHSHLARLGLGLVAALLIALAAGCAGLIIDQLIDDGGSGLRPGLYPVESTVLLTVPGSGVTVSNGGFGSAIARVPGAPRQLYLMTDRGPTVAGAAGVRVFAKPDFAPQIGIFRAEGRSFRRERVIELADAAGDPLTGLPNPPGAGGTGETAVSLDGTALGTDPNGIDPRGLVPLSGGFWVSDGYGPHLVRFDRDGREQERRNPYNGGLPAVFATRRPGAGMTGLTATPDGRALVGIMQSPLDNPDAATGRASRLVRLLWLNLNTGETKQYLYRVDRDASDDPLQVADIAALSQDTFLVLERDGLLPGAGSKKLLYMIDLRTATDVSDPADGPNGLLVGGEPLEALSAGELQGAGIVTAPKVRAGEVADMSANYAHDQPDGLALIGTSLLAISNDDDFGVTGDGGGGVILKPSTTGVDTSEVAIVRLPTGLW